MTSFQSLAGMRSASNESEKLGKSKHKVVKPILKKLSHSEKSSIDLDRGWDEQDGRFAFYESGAIRSGSSKDVTFTYTEPSAGGGRRYHHSRSISGNSHISVATSGSGSGLGIGIGSRSGTTFVHPFQQTPRTATPPPLSRSYANSLASLADRDYSPTITEDDDSHDLDPTSSHTSLHNQNSNPGNHSAIVSGSHVQTSGSMYSPPNPNAYSQPSLLNNSGAQPRRPSLQSQRTSSYSDTPNPKPHAPLRVNTGMRSMSTTPATSSRLAHVSSQAELQSYLAEETSASTNAPAPAHRSIASPTSPIGSMSPFSRTSFEAPGFPRLRAKSDLDTATRAEHVREARKKIQAKQQAKEEKYAREEIKQRERADNKRAQEAEKRAAILRKEREAARRREESAALAEAMPLSSKHARKISTTSSGRPSRSTSRLHQTVTSEKLVNGGYGGMEPRRPPSFGDEAGGARHVSFQSARRTNTAKRKTHGAWTAFVLWLRTRLLRMSN